MNEHTTQLIQELAAKLGTTAEHLWGVLVRQAPISGSIGLICDAILIACVYYGWKWVRGIDFERWDNDLAYAALYGLMGVASAICLCSAFGAIHTEIAGLLNPEYWALKQILK